MKKSYARLAFGILLCTALWSGGCSRQAAQDAPDSDELIEYNGICKKKSELSSETLRWLSWYQSLPEEQQEALSFIPTEFISSGTMVISGTESSEDAAHPSYLNALSEADRYTTEELARNYFSDLSREYGSVEEIQPVADDSPLYDNKGIEDRYLPGNIIIYYVLTERDIEEGTPMRSISIARRSKSDEWKVINCGH